MANEWGTSVLSLEGAVAELRRTLNEVLQAKLHGDSVPTVESLELVTWITKMAAGLLDQRMNDMHTSLPLAWFCEGDIDEALEKLAPVAALVQDQVHMTLMFARGPEATPLTEAAIALTLMQVAVSVLRGVGRR